VAFRRADCPADCPPMCPPMCPSMSPSMSPFFCPTDRTQDTSMDCPPDCVAYPCDGREQRERRVRRALTGVEPQFGDWRKD
jgi:hypothetical protein